MKAMYYPDRRVQYEAALTLASTLPANSFTGSYRVVPILASAVRSSGELFAIVVGKDADTRRETTAFLGTNGWTVVGQGNTASEAIEATGVVPGIDLAVVLVSDAARGISVIEELASFPETTVTPAFVLTSGSDSQILSNELGLSLIHISEPTRPY